MITVSLKLHYALLALSYLGRVDKSVPSQLSDIAASADISIKYLEQIISVLRQAGLIQSLRGAKGGYLLAKKTEDIIILDVFHIILGEDKLDPKIKDSSLFSFWNQLITDSAKLLNYSLADFMLKWYSGNRLTYTI